MATGLSRLAAAPLSVNSQTRNHPTTNVSSFSILKLKSSSSSSLSLLEKLKSPSKKRSGIIVCKASGTPTTDIDVGQDRLLKVPISNIRNFCIIAHIDHGKSTLADKLLQVTGTVPKRDMKEQFLDNMDLERERGITIKLQAARMRYTCDSEPYCLNLIDTPGHVDFSYEVSRSLAACEGALLVVDASQGVEAQTLANVYLALENNLEIITVLNKIDLPGAEPDRVSQEIEELVGLDCTDTIHCSAKEGIGINEILDAIVKRIPPPPNTADNPLRALIFDSYYDPYRGVIVYFRVIDGTIRKGDRVYFMASGKDYYADEIGVLSPNQLQVDELYAGEVGYLSASIRSVADARVGDTITQFGRKADHSLPGYKEATPMVFCGLFPVDADQFPDLRDALGKLQLNDAALKFEPESSSAMGFGFRCGFLGLLHMEIVQERLEREYDLNLITTAPSVVYRVNCLNGNRGSSQVLQDAWTHLAETGEPPPSKIYRRVCHNSSLLPSFTISPLLGNLSTGEPSFPSPNQVHYPPFDDPKYPWEQTPVQSNESSSSLQPVLLPDSLQMQSHHKEVECSNPSMLPEPGRRTSIEEPYVKIELLTPKEYIGPLMELAQDRRGEFKEMKYVTENRASIIYELPLAEMVGDFFDQLKSRSKGYASMEYSFVGYRESELVKLDIQINGDRVEPLATIVHKEKAYAVGRALTQKLKELIPRQMFKVPIQASIGAKVIASEALSAIRKDVLSKCYGGDITRKKKLLKKQAEGKKRMKAIGRVEVPQEAFMAVLKLEKEVL